MDNMERARQIVTESTSDIAAAREIAELLGIPMHKSDVILAVISESQTRGYNKAIDDVRAALPGKRG